MGNNHSGPYPGHRLKKSVHYKAESPASPGKPDIVPLGWAEDGVTLRWKPPRYDGGSPLTGYQVECNRLGSSAWVRTSPPLVLRPELLLTGLEPGFQYQFRVSACNAVGVSLAGEISDILTVSIDKAPNSAPKFISQLQDAIAVENDKVEFKIYFEASPQPTISWFKDGYEIFSSRRTAIITEGNCSTLIFHQTSLSDEGEVKCTATNRAGHSVCRAKLSLEAAPRVRLPRNYEEGLLYETDETIFLKVAVAGKPTPDIEWRHNGQLIIPSSRIEIATTEKFSTLRIENASRDDRGEYQINAINRVGEDYASFLVTITARPNPPESVAVVQNADKSVSLSWVSPNDDGGCQIGNYVIEYYRTGWNVWLKAATSRKLTATLFDLIEGSEYRFRVKAESPYGMSEPSAETRPIFIPGKSNEMKFNAMDLDFKTPPPKTEVELPQVVPRRKRNLSPKIDEAENEVDVYNEYANKYTLEIPTGVTLRKQRHVEKKENSVKPNVLKESNDVKYDDMLSGEKMNNGSSEFMLVLYPEEDEKENKEKRKSFQLDLEEAMSPPPLSLSAPDLGFNFLPIRPLRHSVSSTELLHERAMNRFYQVVALKEAKEGANNSSQTTKENLPEIKINIIKDDSVVKEVDQSKEEQPNEKDNITPERKMEELVVSNESLAKDKGEDSGSIYEDDYTASTVSTGDSEVSDSDSLGNDVDTLRSRIEENTTYHPRDMTMNVQHVQSPAVEVLTKPAPLPDPNFVPKPILKKRETDVPPRVSPLKEIPAPIPVEEIPQVVEQEKESKPKQSEKLLNKVPLFKKFAKFPMEKGVFSDKKKSKNKAETKEAPEVPAVKVEEKVDTVQDEGRCAIEQYGAIVKEYGQNKKPVVKLFTNTEDLKKAAADQQKLQPNNRVIIANNRQVRPRPPVQVKVVAKPAPATERTVKKIIVEKKPVVVEKKPPPPKQKPAVEPPKPKREVEIEKVSVSKSFSEINAEAESNVKTAFNYVIDMFILCVAFWLYLFKDERLAIPFLILTMYRQVHSAIKNRIPLWLRNRISPGD